MRVPRHIIRRPTERQVLKAIENVYECAPEVAKVHYRRLQIEGMLEEFKDLYVYTDFGRSKRGSEET